MISDRSNDHLSGQGWERSWNMNVFSGAHPVRLDEAILLGELLDAVLGLKVVQSWFIIPLEQVDFVGAEYDWNRLAVDTDNLINLLLPLGGVLNRLQVADISYHDDALGLPAEVPVQTLIAGVHANEIPNFEPDVVALHLQ